MNFKIDVDSAAILRRRGLGDSAKAKKHLASTDQ